MIIPTDEQIAEKRGFHLFSCSQCGEPAYYKNRVSKPLCETCKVKKHTDESRERWRKERIKTLLKKETNEFDIKLIICELKDIIEKHNISKENLERIFLTYVKEFR